MAGLGGEFLLIFLLVALNAFFAASEIAMVSVRQARLQQLAEEGNDRAKKALSLLKEPSRFLATIQVGVTLANFFASAAATITLSESLAAVLRRTPVTWVSQAASGIAVIVVTLAVSYLTLVLGELAPKRMALQKAESISLKVSTALFWLSRIASPAIAFLSWSTNNLLNLFGVKSQEEGDRVTEEEIKLLVNEQGSLLEEEKTLIHSIFTFGDTIAREVMVPRTDMVGVREEAGLEAAIDLAVSTGFSRLPVYRDSLDHIVGFLFLKDLIRASREQQTLSLGQLARPAMFIPEGKEVIPLLKELQANRQSMAIVVDEYGGTAGLITMEDLLEEIVGEINDEDEEDPAWMSWAGEGQMVVHGRVNVEDLNEAMGIELPVEEHYETVGGLVMDLLGRIPKAGDRVEQGNAVLLVEKMTGRRVDRVRVIREEKKEQENHST